MNKTNNQLLQLIKDQTKVIKTHQDHIKVLNEAIEHQTWLYDNLDKICRELMEE